jgi:hypothetical protein
MKWLSSTNLFTDLKREKADESKINLINYILDAREDFDEKNYSLKFNHLSLREFGNVFNEDYMTSF